VRCRFPSDRGLSFGRGAFAGFDTACPGIGERSRRGLRLQGGKMPPAHAKEPRSCVKMPRCDIKIAHCSSETSHCHHETSRCRTETSHCRIDVSRRCLRREDTRRARGPRPVLRAGGGRRMSRNPHHRAPSSAFPQGSGRSASRVFAAAFLSETRTARTSLGAPKRALPSASPATSSLHPNTRLS
jgi:hypothetical protein